MSETVWTWYNLKEKFIVLFLAQRAHESPRTSDRPSATDGAPPEWRGQSLEGWVAA